MQPDLIILEAPKQEMKIWGFEIVKNMEKSGVFIPCLGAFKVIKSGWT
jgi:hypothetical protein